MHTPITVQITIGTQTLWNLICPLPTYKNKHMILGGHVESLTFGFACSFMSRVPGDSQEIVLQTVCSLKTFVLLHLNEICTNLTESKVFTTCIEGRQLQTIEAPEHKQHMRHTKKNKCVCSHIRYYCSIWNYFSGLVVAMWMKNINETLFEWCQKPIAQ